MKQSGFSLLEIIISLLISSIAISASFSSLKPSTKVAAQRIESFLRSSLNESLISGENVYVRKSGNKLIARSETYKKAISIPVQFRFQGSRIVFYVSGAASPKTVNILGAPLCRVTLSLRGRILEKCSA